MDTTAKLTERNQPIIASGTQEALSSRRVLIAGCGLGSAVAESFVRMGVKRFALIDNDVVEAHNLNRQAFRWHDIQTEKVRALEGRLREINPEVEVEVFEHWLTVENASNTVATADVVIDTIDFLDLPAVVALHDQALLQGIPVISLFTAGWGAIGIFVPGGHRTDSPYPNRSWIRDTFELPNGACEGISYTERFVNFFTRLSPHLHPNVQEMMRSVQQRMLDLKPCPASQIIAGAHCASLLAMKLLSDHLEGRPILTAPDFIYLELDKIFSQSRLVI